MGVELKPALIDISEDDDLSEAVEVGLDVIVGLEIPAIDSAAIYIQAAVEDGKTFRRILKMDGSGDFEIAASTGNKFIWLEIGAPFTFFKIETGAAQTADRLFNFVLKK